MEYSCSCSLLARHTGVRRLLRVVAHDRDEQVGDAGRAHIAQSRELTTIDMIKQKNAAAEYLALMQWFERSCPLNVIGMHHHFRVARLEFVHAALEHDPAAIDEHQIGQDVLYFFDLVRRYNDRAAAIEIIIQQ